MQPTKFFKCLSDDTRLKSIVLIHNAGEACVCELMEALALDQPKISRHLAELRKCGILQDERRGKWVYYKLHPQLAPWQQQVIEQTAQHNGEYYADALSLLKKAQAAMATCC